MRIIIIGASGVIGSAFYSLAAERGKDVVGTCCSQQVEGLLPFDMCTTPLVGCIPDLNEDDIVCLMAAYSNPSWVFANQEVAERLNIEATKRVVDHVARVGARLIYMSSVEVFDGGAGNYQEDDPPGPLNLYGQMKYTIEKYVSGNLQRYTIVRTGWNVGWNMSERCVITMTYETLLQTGARMASDNIFSIVDVRDTARGLLKICDDESIRICHLASTPPVLRSELAHQIKRISRFGSDMDFEVVSFSEIPYSEPRGRCNHLDNRLARSRLGVDFRQSDEIVAEKVHLLDRFFKERRTLSIANTEEFSSRAGNP